MHVETGIDIVEVERIRNLINKHGAAFLKRIYTADEIVYCQSRRRKFEHFAARFAAKEAVLKVLGTGLVKGLALHSVEVTNDVAGKPEIRLSGEARQLARALGIRRIALSLSHCDSYAVASATAIVDKEDE